VKKDIVHRIAFYLKKVADKSSIHPSKKQPTRFKYRNERLRLYKRLMHERIKEAGY
jgi:hypothetical protein